MGKIADKIKRLYKWGVSPIPSSELLTGTSIPILDFGFIRFGIRLGVPIFLECQRCTACCRWPGQVRLTEAEISRLAAFKGMTEHDFIQQFTRLQQDRQGLALQEKADGGCIFLEGDDCSVQPVKPQQCRDFPNLWNFPGFEKVCRAVPVELGEEEFARRVVESRTKPGAF